MATAQLNSETRTEIKYITAADVRPEPIRWLWKDFLPLGKMTMLAGPGGVGKSTIAFDMAARVTTGADWPDGSKGRSLGDVLIWSAEDDLADTIVPRLMAANANLQRIRFPAKVYTGEKERTFNPAIHMEKLCQDLRTGRGNILLLIIDPIISAVSGNMNQANDVRNDLQPLVDALGELEISGLGISHLAKPSASNPRSVTDSVLGSQAFTALPRMNWVANWSKRHDAHVLAKGKQNITRPGGIKYSIVSATIPNPKSEEPISTTCIEWGNSMTERADDIFRVEREDKKQPSAAEDFLEDALSDGKKHRATELFELAEASGITKSQLGYAKRKRGIEDGKGSDKFSYWFLPSAEQNPPEQCTDTPS